MMITETARSAWRSLASNRMRTLLTMLGMIIGTAAVVAVLGIGEGARSSVEGRIRSLGTNLVTVRPMSARGSGGVRSGAVQTLTRKDADALSRLPGIAAVAPEGSGSAQLKYQSQNMNASVTGVTSAYFDVRSLAFASGVGITDLDDQQRTRVVVLGSNVKQQLYGEESPLGSRLQINGKTFRVIGVLAEKGSTMGSPDDGTFVPLGTHQSSLFGQNYLSSMSLKLSNESEAAAVQAKLTEILRLRHGLRADQENDFDVRSQTEMLETMSQVTGTFTALLGSVAAVSLIVGGIGIMNIMLVSVTERTREIGLRKALGARYADIMYQFLIESVVMTVSGGAAGVALGIGASMLITVLAGWAVKVSAASIALATLFSIVVGLVFGVWPARRAASLNPIEALRYE